MSKIRFQINRTMMRTRLLCRVTAMIAFCISTYVVSAILPALPAFPTLPALPAASAGVSFLSNTVPAYASEGERTVSLKTGMGSLGSLTDADEDTLAELDLEEGLIADRDAAFEAERSSASYKSYGFTKKDLKYMACVIYCEATSMTYEAKIAVGNVILNRMRNTDPNGWAHVSTIKEVIYDNKWGTQFAVTLGKPSPMDQALSLYKSMDPDKFKEWQILEMKAAKQAAKDVLTGVKTIPDDFCYFNGKVDSSITKCRNNGWGFSVMGMEDSGNSYKHIYFGGSTGK